MARSSKVLVKSLIKALAARLGIETSNMFDFMKEAEEAIAKFLEPYKVTEITISPFRNNAWTISCLGKKGAFTVPWYSMELTVEELAGKRFEDIAKRFRLCFITGIEVLLTDEADLTKSLKAVVESANGSVWISVEGYASWDLEEGGAIACLEVWEGRLRLLVYSDVNEEEPTIIDLENARAECYRY